MRFSQLSENRLFNSVTGFLAAGGLATLAHWIVMYGLIQAGCAPLAATVSGSLIGAALNYVAQRTLAFRNAGPHRSALWRYTTSCVFAAALNAAVFSLLMHWLHAPVFIAQMVTTGVVAAVNYVVYKRLVFHEQNA